MFSYQVYKLVHYAGLLLIFTAFGGMLFARPKDNPNRATLFALHGTGLLLMLVGGFGMLARLGIMSGGFPLWIWLKLGVWIALGGFIVLAKRKPEWKKILIPVLVGFGLASAAFALYKPGMTSYMESQNPSISETEESHLDPTADEPESADESAETPLEE